MTLEKKFCNGLCLLSTARTGELWVKAILVSPGCSWPGASSAPSICQQPSSRPQASPGCLPLGAKLPCCLPRTTRRAPTGAHRPCSCRLSSPWAWTAQLTHRGHHKQSCQSLEPASSSSAQYGTDSPRHRSWSIRSTGWSPTSTSSPQKRKHKGKPR